MCLVGYNRYICVCGWVTHTQKPGKGRISDLHFQFKVVYFSGGAQCNRFHRRCQTQPRRAWPCPHTADHWPFIIIQDSISTRLSSIHQQPAVVAGSSVDGSGSVVVVVVIDRISDGLLLTGRPNPKQTQVKALLPLSFTHNGIKERSFPDLEVKGFWVMSVWIVISSQFVKISHIADLRLQLELGLIIHCLRTHYKTGAAPFLYMRGLVLYTCI